MKFKEAVEATPSLVDAWRTGLGALSGVNKQHIAPEDPRRLRGSVDIDTTLKDQYQNDPRWDYGIGHQPTNMDEEIVYWVEIHPASGGEVNVVLNKLAWLLKWLRDCAPHLKSMRKAFIWVSSGKTSFTLSSPQQKQFALKGLQHTGRVLKIPNHAVP